MSGATFHVTVELRPSGELMLLGDALVCAIEGLTAAATKLAELQEREHAALRPQQGQEVGGHLGDATTSRNDTPSPPPAPTGTAVDAPARAAAVARPEVVPAPAAETAAAGAGSDIERQIKAAEQKTPAAKKQHWCTDERKAVLIELYPTSRTPVSILTELRQLPGPEVPSWGNVGSYAAVTFGLRRPQSAPTAPSKLARAMTMPPQDEAIPKAYEPIEVDFDQVAQWAGSSGITFKTWDDLPHVNAKREALSIPTFKRKLPGRSVHRSAAAVV